MSASLPLPFGLALRLAFGCSQEGDRSKAGVSLLLSTYLAFVCLAAHTIQEQLIRDTLMAVLEEASNHVHGSNDECWCRLDRWDLLETSKRLESSPQVIGSVICEWFIMHTKDEVVPPRSYCIPCLITPYQESS